jgi:hypothetical protein
MKVNPVVTEVTVLRVSVFHGGHRVAFREVDFFGDVAKFRDARQEAESLAEFLKENPFAETVPLQEGWRMT